MREHGDPRSSPSTATARSSAFDVLRDQLLDRARLHQLPGRARARRNPAAVARPHRRAPDRHRRRPRRVQPRADRRLHRRGRARRRRAGRRSASPRLLRAAQGRAAGTASDPARARRDAGSRTCRASTTSTTPPTAASPASRPTRPASRAARPSTPSPTSTPGRIPKQPLVPLAESVHERMSVEIFRGCTRGCRFCQAGHDHPSGPRAQHHRHRRDGRRRAGRDRLRRGRPAQPVVAPTTPRSARSPRVWPTATRAPRRRSRCRPPGSTRSTSRWPRSSARGGRRSGLTFAPEGGSRAAPQGHQQDGHRRRPDQDRHDRVRGGWTQVKLYFMCGLPTETDEDVLQIAAAGQVGHPGRAGGDRAPRHPVHGVDRRVRPQAAHARSSGRPSWPRTRPTAGWQLLRDAIGRDRSIGFRYHDGKPGIIEGLLSRGDRRVGAVIAEVVRRGGRFDGWSEYFSYDRWMAGGRGGGHRRRLVHHARAHPLRGAALGPPRLRPRRGMALVGLAGRPRRARDRRLPLVAVLRLRGLPDHGHRDRDRPDRPHAAAADARAEPELARSASPTSPAADRGRAAAAAALRQARPAAVHLPPRRGARVRTGDPAGRASRWRTRPASPPIPRISWAGAAPTGAASEAEYVELGLAEARDPVQLGPDLDAALAARDRRAGGRHAQPGTGKLADRIDRLAVGDPALRDRCSRSCRRRSRRSRPPKPRRSSG